MTEPDPTDATDPDQEGGPEPPTLAELFAHPLFPEYFAAFLRLHPALWRIRRVDRFAPLDLDLAAHHTSIQGLINAELLNAFLEKEGGNLRIETRPEVKTGEVLPVYIPALSAPKRLLLSFSARSEIEEPLPVLSRAEGSGIAARDILARLVRNANKKYSLPDEDDAEGRQAVGLMLDLITTLAYSNPHRLAERLVSWSCRRHRLRRGRAVRPDVGLHYEGDLRAWIKQEADEFLHGLSTPLLAKLEGQIKRVEEGKAGMEIPASSRPDGIRYFATIRTLVLHDIQDVLKTLVQATDPWIPATHRPDDAVDVTPTAEQGELSNRRKRHPLKWLKTQAASFVGRGEKPARTPQTRRTTQPPFASEPNIDSRVILAGSATALAGRVGAVFSAIDALEDLLSHQQTEHARDELYYHLDRWTAYAVDEIRIGLPFVLKFSEALPLTARRTLRSAWWLRWAEAILERARLLRTTHRYPLAPQDALSVHVEVEVDDPQLRLDDRSEVVVIDAEGRVAVEELIFGHVLRPTERLLHRYSSRRPESWRIPDPIALLVRPKLNPPIRNGYVAAAIAFLFAGVYTATIFGTALRDQQHVAHLDRALTIAALGVTLSLWLTATQHPRAIVDRKLWAARLAFYVSLGLILGPVLAYGWRHSRPKWGYNWLARQSDSLYGFTGDRWYWFALLIVGIVLGLRLVVRHSRPILVGSWRRMSRAARRRVRGARAVPTGGGNAPA